MIKITLFPNNGIGITDKSWDFLKALSDHAKHHGRNIYSLMEYAVKLPEFLKNIESDMVWKVQYCDNMVKIFNNVDWEKRFDSTVNPVALIQLSDNVPF
jgi:hypothetical protein